MNVSHPFVNYFGRSSRQTLMLTGAPLAVLAVGLAMRIYHLGDLSVWIDEADTVRIARMGFADMVGALAQESCPPLYLLLLRFWMFLFGEGPTAIRLLSVLFGGALIGYVFIVGRRFFSYQTGLVAAILMAVAPAQIVHSQQCRMYTLLPLFALGAFHCLKNAADTGSRTWLAGWVVCMTGAIYTHNYGWFLFPVCLWILWFNRELHQHPLRWIAATAVIGIAYLPWSPFFWQQLQNGLQNSWYQHNWDGLGPHGNLFCTFDSFSGGRRSLSFVWAKSDPFLIPRVLLFLAASALAIFMVFRKDSDSAIKKNTRDILAFLLLPLMTALIISMIASPIYRFGRADQLVFPAFILLTAVGITAFRKPSVVLILTALLTIFSLTNYPPVTASATMQGDAAVARTILSLARPGDAILSTSMTIGPLEYYARRAQVRIPLITFPRDDIFHPVIRNDAGWLAKPEALAFEARAAMIDACRATAPGGRVFVILGVNAFNRPLYNNLRQRSSSRVLLLPQEYVMSVTNTPLELLIVTCR